MYFIFYPDGAIMTWGEEIPDGIYLELPADWGIYGPSKYKYDGTGLVPRDDWQEPAAE
jgi:hypothetical protein